MRDLQRWHEKRHPPGPMETCWSCGQQKAKCKSKLFRYEDRDEAILDAQRMNEADNYVKPRVAYLCAWCGLYHHTTKINRRREFMKKQMRKWLTKQELERRRRLGDGVGLPGNSQGSSRTA